MLGTATKLKTPRNISLTGDVTGSASFDGSNNVVIKADLANIAILTGTINVTNGKGEADVSYPGGFNNSNSVVLSAAVSHGVSTSEVYIFGSNYDRSVGVTLYTNQIRIITNSLDGVGPTGKIKYKIVLMKI